LGDFESAGRNTVATFLDNTGRLHVDHNGGAGGTILNIGATLTNSGNLVIGGQSDGGVARGCMSASSSESFARPAISAQLRNGSLTTGRILLS
jgi:hypothetical protein